MIDLNLLREKPEVFQKGAEAKGIKIDTEKILALDEKVRDLRFKIEDLRKKRNEAAGKKDIEAGKKIKEELKQPEAELVKIEPELKKLLLEIPNPPTKDVKIGKDESENEILREVGGPARNASKLSCVAGGKTAAKKDYLTLAKELDLIDIDRAAKVSGSRFGYIKGKLAQLEFALVQYGLETLAAAGFIPIVPPVLISEKAMEGMGYLEHQGHEEAYHLKDDKLYLVGTSEQSIGPMHMDEILDAEKLPLKYVGFSTCFRREAGSYGKDTSGILRVHQFDKLEMFVFCCPEESDKIHEDLLALEEKIMAGLKLPYRVVKMCSADLGAPAARKYDLEAWLPSEKTYRETHSTSNCTDFQARRLNIRYKSKISNLKSKIGYVHMLNGTAIAVGRMLIAIIENCQQEDNSIKVPEVLQKYCGFNIIK